MIFSVVNECDIFYNYDDCNAECSVTERSSNPYDYLNSGYYLDNAVLFGGANNVNFNCDISGNRTGHNMDSARV